MAKKIIAEWWECDVSWCHDQHKSQEEAENCEQMAQDNKILSWTNKEGDYATVRKS